jgi:hypothetical protein
MRPRTIKLIFTDELAWAKVLVALERAGVTDLETETASTKCAAIVAGWAARAEAIDRPREEAKKP